MLNIWLKSHKRNDLDLKIETKKKKCKQKV